MTAVTPTVVEELAGSAPNLQYGTTNRPVKLLYVEVTTTATTDTTDLSTYGQNITGILGIVMQTQDDAIDAGTATWSGTTVTWANHAGSGGNKYIFAVY